MRFAATRGSPDLGKPQEQCLVLDPRDYQLLNPAKSHLNRPQATSQQGEEAKWEEHEAPNRGLAST